jgi:2,3-dihydroxyphenylpropionate 1,2-dioxygenase
MSHAPGLTGWPDAPPQEVRDRIASSVHQIREYLLAAKPDLIVAFLDDHFDNLSRNLMPPLALGVAPRHWGPAEHYFEVLQMTERREIPSSEGFAEALLRHFTADGFDVARVGEIEYCQNLMVPLELVWPENHLPVVPVLINVFSPPLTPPSRAHDLGASLRRMLDQRPERVAVLATGGLSHWPPFWNDHSPEDDAFLQRMKRFQTEGRHVLAEDPDLLTDLGRYEIEMAEKAEMLLVNEEWDRRFLKAFAEGDSAFMRSLSWEKTAEEAGPGANEMLNWIALMGAMGDAPAEILSYDVSPEWITGVGFAVYP